MSRLVLDRWDWATYVAEGRLTGAQRAVLQAIARHANDQGAGSFVSQAAMAASAGIDPRNVRNAVRRLEAEGLITGEPRPGKSTLWTINLDRTPDADIRGDPGCTPDAPRMLASPEGEGEGNPSLTPYVAKGRGRGSGNRRSNGNGNGNPGIDSDNKVYVFRARAATRSPMTPLQDLQGVEQEANKTKLRSLPLPGSKAVHR